MIPFIRAIRQNGTSSPYGLVAAACAVFVVAWVFPPSLYTYYMREPNWMFLDPLTALFFFLCVATFLLGMKLQRMLRPFAWSVSLPELSTISPVLYVGVPLLLGIAYCGADLVSLGAKVNVVAILAAHQGQELKDMAHAGKSVTGGILGRAPIALTGILWWLLFRVRQLRTAMSFRFSLKFAWFLALLLVMVTSIADVSRVGLMTAVGGSGIVWVFTKESRGNLSLSRRFLVVIGGALCVGGLFTVVSILRGSAAPNLLIESIMGYSVASYNRLAAILHGGLTYIFGGRGIYLFMYLQNADSLDKIVPFQQMLHWPNSLTLFSSEFSSNELAGLNRSYIWSGVFGYLYADLGWAAPIYTLFAGILTGYAWTRFRRGTSVGIMLYTWIALWIVFWNGSNGLFGGQMVQLMYVGILLAVWDRLMLIPVAPVGAGQIQPASPVPAAIQFSA